MNEFIGREIELKNLNNMYNSDKFEMAVIYGRRRVGKTSLIKQFISNKPAIYVQGVEATAETNLRFLSNAILDFEEPGRINKHKTFCDFAEAFEEVQDIVNNQNEKMIFVMDEYPYFAEASAEISSILQYTIDHIYKEKIILCYSCVDRQCPLWNIKFLDIRALYMVEKLVNLKLDLLISLILRRCYLKLTKNIY